MHHANIGIHVIDKDRKTVIYNDVMAKLEGLKREQITGERYLRYLS